MGVVKVVGGQVAVALCAMKPCASKPLNELKLGFFG